MSSTGARAHLDRLTGLPDRIAFGDSLTAGLARAASATKGLALLCIDIDRLDTINATLGHAAGDAVLEALAERIDGVCGDEDVLARMSGDAFGVLMLEAGPAEAAAMASAILDVVRAPVALETGSITVGASVGIALAPEHASAMPALLQCAEGALARAKAAGGDAFCIFAADLDDALRARRWLELDLRGALARSEFSISYQPIVRMADGAAIAQEALLRWNLPGRGEIAAETFIPVAEETGLIVPIGEWVLAQACADGARFAENVAVSVNVSAVQLSQPGFEADLWRIAAAAGLPAHRLILEITETALTDSRVDTAGLFARLRAGGIRVALDDFGSGYAALDKLRRSEFDILKLDHAYGNGIAEPATAAIVEAVLALGRRLDVQVIVEGAETPQQRETLRRAGCEFAQGHHYGMPRKFEPERDQS